MKRNTLITRIIYACALVLLCPWMVAAQEKAPEPKPGTIVIQYDGKSVQLSYPDGATDDNPLLRADEIILYDAEGNRFVYKTMDDLDPKLAATMDSLTVWSKDMVDTWKADIARGLTVRRDPDRGVSIVRQFDNDRLLPLFESHFSDSWQYGTLEQRKKLTEMETEARDLAVQARRAEGQEQKALEEALEEKLQMIFVLKLEMREASVRELRAEADEVETALAERASNREAIIQRRLDQLLGRSSKYDW